MSVQMQNNYSSNEIEVMFISRTPFIDWSYEEKNDY